ncbi:MAG: glycosyltransferase [Bacteroidales bacterium]|nr:glycosyltransferase [Bacteroidales bacterium]MBN2697742.1 glycosyltransferase [Bacteroidales bacterium]
MKNFTVVIIGSAWPLRGGLAAYNERLAREFQHSDCTVTIETFTLQYPKFLFPGKTQYADWEAPADLRINASINSINPINWIKVGCRLRRAKPDLVIIKYWLPFMGPCFGTLGRMIKRNRHSKVVSILDNIIPHEKRPGDRAFTRYFIKPVDGFVAMSESVIEDIGQFNREKPRRYCPHPLYDHFGEKIDKTEAKKYLGLDPGTQYILFFGFIREYKGLDLLIRAMASKEFSQTDVSLIIAGEFYTDATPYMNLIKEHKLTDRIVLHKDFIPDFEVKYYFSASDLVVQPYRSATQSGISQIAYHFDKPMVVTNVGGLPEIVPDRRAGFVVNREPDEIARAISEFYERNLEESFSANVAIEKKKFGWDRMVRNIFELIGRNLEPEK